MDSAALMKKMSHVVDSVSSDLSSLRTGRATPALVEGIVVAAYGGTQRLKIVELAAITISDPQTIIIDPWDKSIIGEVKQAILAANIGLTPSIDGEVIRLSVPPMTSEDREKYVKLLSAKIENAKVSIRQVRAEFMGDIKKEFEGKQISEDERVRQEKDLQNETDSHIKKIIEMGEKKEKELMTI